jgi:cytochrome oxidase Cu insertion factor (SCO1/SenC/PrrC family)
VVRRVALVAVVLAAFAALGSSAGAAFVPVLHEGDAVPTLPLVDQDGRAFSLGDLRPNAVVVSFLYTRCRVASMCPLVAAKFARMQRAIGASRVRLVTLTLDPTYDTPAVLKRYGAAYAEDPRRWRMGTGAPDALEELAARLGIAPGVVVHTEAVAVLDPAGRVARLVDGNAWTPDEILAAARAAAGEGTLGPLAAARLWLSEAVAVCGGRTGALTGTVVLAILAACTGIVGAAFARAFSAGSRRAG